MLMGSGLGTANPATAPAMSVQDDFMIVGDQAEPAGRHGQVFVYTPSGESWALHQTLTDGSGLSGAGWFGYGISRDGNWLAVSSTHAVAPSGEGDCQMFELVEGSWVYRQYIQPDDITLADEIPVVVVRGDWLAMSSPWHDAEGVTNAGAVWLYKLVGGTWTFQQKLTEAVPTASSQFGITACMNGDAELFLGAGSSAGKVYRYTRDGDTWSLATTITPASPRAGGETFGYSLACDGATLMIGGTMQASTVIPGGVYFFEWSGSAWVQTESFIFSDVQPRTRYPNQIAVSGDLAVAGSLFADWTTIGPGQRIDSKGRADVFRRIGGVWQRAGVLRPSDRLRGDWFGSSVAIHDGEIYILSGSALRNGFRRLLVSRFVADPADVANIVTGSIAA